MMLRKAASERDLYRMCTKTFTWRLLTGPELTEVYLNEMRRDFPAGELEAFEHDPDQRSGGHRPHMGRV